MLALGVFVLHTANNDSIRVILLSLLLVAVVLLLIGSAIALLTLHSQYKSSLGNYTPGLSNSNKGNTDQ